MFKDIRIQKAFIIIIFVASFIAFLIGSTFAYWTWQSTNAQKTAVTFTVSSGFSCRADGGGNITSSDVMLAPADCTNTNYAIKRTVKVSTTQNSGKTIYLDMNLTVNSIGTNLANSTNFKYALTTNSNSCKNSVVAEGNFYGATANTEKMLLKTERYTTTTNNDTYYLWIWLDKEETNNAIQNESFDISLTGSCTDEEPATITTEWGEMVDRYTKVNFSQTSVANGTNGLYLFKPSANDTHPIYYYRGNVTTNNVLFGGYCWKIVRTTETGGTKLVYNGTPVDGECTNTTEDDTQLATTKAFNTYYQSPADVGYMYGTRYPYSSKSSSNLATSYKYGNGFNWNGSTYILRDTIDSTGTWATDYNTLNNNHYTCFNTTGSCTSLYYIYYTDTSNAYYITLTNGKSVENALDEMLTSSSNTTDSTIKAYIDDWYEGTGDFISLSGNSLSNYESSLEDAIWCNDRSISSLGGWNPNGGNTFSNYQLYFSPYYRMYTGYSPIVTCPSKNDSFTKSNTTTGNGALDNPIGLLTIDEIKMAGATGSGNSSFYLYTNHQYWSASPFYFYYFNAYEFHLYSSGSLHFITVNYAGGARPAVSLKPGATWTGSGTTSNPYVPSWS